MGKKGNEKWGMASLWFATHSCAQKYVQACCGQETGVLMKMIADYEITAERQLGKPSRPYRRKASTHG